MSEILGKVTSSYEIPRGADVALRIRVPEAWLIQGRTIELELPRHLTCARCSGGGCDTCGQSGAITLRGKTELPEVVQVVLPSQKLSASSNSRRVKPAPQRDETAATNPERGPDSQPSSARPVVIRIPECGGLPDATNRAIVRGMLLLEVGTAVHASPDVRLIEDDEPMSSSKMLRAQIRSSANNQQVERASPNARLAPLDTPNQRPPRRMPELLDDSQPPSSRVARVSSAQPPPAEQRRASEAGQKSALPQRSVRTSGALYVAIVVLAALGLLALLLL